MPAPRGPPRWRRMQETPVFRVVIRAASSASTTFCSVLAHGFRREALLALAKPIEAHPSILACQPLLRARERFLHPGAGWASNIPRPAQVWVTGRILVYRMTSRPSFQSGIASAATLQHACKRQYRTIHSRECGSQEHECAHPQTIRRLTLLNSPNFTARATLQ
jgi:hypothetical protein